jgi:hypothetical protein
MRKRKAENQVRKSRAVEGEKGEVMRTVLSAMLLLAISVSPAWSVEGDGKAKTNPAGPQLEISPELHDFGKAKQNQRLVKEFEIENTGSEELKIGRISTSCGCTVARPSVRVLKPGETTTLEVTLETRRYIGNLQRSIAIASNDPKRIKTVKVKVYVEQ